MVDFNIQHYLDFSDVEEKEMPEWYGKLEDKPETEQALFALQEKWLKTKDSNTWAEMYLLAQQYMGSLLKKRLTGTVYLEPEEIEDKTSQAVVKFMSKYLTNPKFEVGTSFAGMMKWPIVEVLYGKENLKVDSLDRILSKDANVTVGDLISDDGINAVAPSPEDAVLDSPVDCIIQILKELEEMQSVANKTKIFIYLYLILTLRGPRNRHSKRVFQDNWLSDYRDKKVLDLTLLEIYNRLSQE